MDELRFVQLTKEMVAEELRLLGDPCTAAAAVVRKTLQAAFQVPSASDAAPARVIEETVKGAMTALLLADHSLTRGSILVVEAVMDVAAKRDLDPTDSMRAALRGLADLKRFVDPARIDDIRLEIEAHYMGAGVVFMEYLRAAPAKVQVKV
ncbi:MAG: hypothetical protein HY923_11110 [Elusimicrobia bacterium]|nr:hypothetical protein [Elusimicrobiota bacterium]